jgi:hypothetical protein
VGGLAIEAPSGASTHLAGVHINFIPRRGVRPRSSPRACAAHANPTQLQSIARAERKAKARDTTCYTKEHLQPDDVAILENAPQVWDAALPACLR